MNNQYNELLLSIGKLVNRVDNEYRCNDKCIVNYEFVGQNAIDKMQITVRTLFGKCIKLTIDSSWTINNIKQAIQDVLGVAYYRQKLIHNGSLIENGKLDDNDTIYLVIDNSKNLL